MSRWSARPTELLSRIEVVPTITLEHLPTATLILDGMGRVAHFNQRASTLLERHGSMLYGMRVVELLGRDLLGTSTEASASTFPLTLALPSGRRSGVIASLSPMSESTEGTLLMVALTPTRIEGQQTIERVPRITPWAEVAERVAGLDCETLCVAVGIVGLRSVNDSFSRSAGDSVITEIARRFIAITPVGTVVERITGDRFVVASPSDGDDECRVADIMRAVLDPIDTRLGPAAVGCAAGVTSGLSSPSLVLLDRADRNLSVALGRGAGTIEWSDVTRPQRVFVGGRLGRTTARRAWRSERSRPTSNLSSTSRRARSSSTKRWRVGKTTAGNTIWQLTSSAWPKIRASCAKSGDRCWAPRWNSPPRCHATLDPANLASRLDQCHSFRARRRPLRRQGHDRARR